MIKKIAVLTSGGDAPGMNAAIRAVVRTALHHNIEVMGVHRGYSGLLNGEMFPMNRSSVSDIIQRGGTILRTARCEEFKKEEVRKEAVKILQDNGVDALVVIGGDGSFTGAKLLSKLGVKTIGLPGTIDNDLSYTDYTIGFDTALNTVTDAVDKIRDTSTSHERVSIVEVMGRNCGDIALYAGIACGAEYIITPEKGYDKKELCDIILDGKKKGKMHNLILLAEGVGGASELAKYIENETKIEELTRSGELILDDDNSDRRYYSMTPLEEELKKSYGKEYKEYFSKRLPASKNDVGEDMVRFSQFANAIHRLKSSKNRIALSLYSFLELNDNQKRNYGIVVDRVSEDGTFGEVKHFVDFAVDINSMFPVNVHLPQNIFADFAKEYFKSPIVPIYAGSDDWDMPNGKRVKSHIMVPWSKKSKKTIKQVSKNNKAYSQKVVNHFRFLSDATCVPMHFKKAPKDKQIHKTYINLDTNSILERTKEGIFIKVLPQGQGDDERFDR